MLPMATAAQRKNDKNAKPAVAASATTEAKAGLDAITAAQMREMLTFLAADEMEGRDTPSRGLDTAARFLAYNLARWGFKPAGDNGTYFQKFNLRRGSIDGGQTKLEIAGQVFKFGDDLLPRPLLKAAKGQLVYVGHGMVVKSKNINAYAGIDVKDKIVIAAEGTFTKDVQPPDLKGKVGVDYDTAASYAAAHGARGLLLVPSPTVLKNWETVQRGLSNSRPTIEAANGTTVLPTAYVSEKVLKAIFTGEKVDGSAILKEAETGAFTPAFVLKDKEASLTVGGNLESVPTQNVVAIWEGSDPALKNEYVAVGAHYDHEGVRGNGKQDEGRPDGGRNDTWSRYKAYLDATGKFGGEDRLWNGADDDGSGTTAVLAIAEALTKAPRAKRSVILVWHAGEEKGLLGSAYFTARPTVPINQIVTQLNIDMIGRSRPADYKGNANSGLTDANSIYVIGSKKMSSELGQVSEAVNHGYLKLGFDYKYDDPNDNERLFYRSDHYNYALKGIPIIFYFDGIHEHYHRPADEPERIDYDKMEKVTRTIFATLWELANRATRVKVDKPL
jgi:hypothetical protein